MMGAPPAIGETGTYPAQLSALVTGIAGRLVQSPTAPHRVEAVARLRTQSFWLIAIGAVLVVALMFGADAAEIAMMPPRGAPAAWPARAITDFGKGNYVLSFLGVSLVAVTLAIPAMRGDGRSRLSRLATHLQFLFIAVAVPVLFGEIIKYAVGRGRPFVGGSANPFNFAPFAGTEAYFSFPSAHSITVFALAFGVASISPRWRVPIFLYALAISASRLVMLAHHPSDVVAGAVIGLLGALAVRAWFAVREIDFAIEPDGKIVARRPG